MIFFESNFTTAFELFKDLKEAEHRKILDFVKSHYNECKTYKEEENIIELFDFFKQKETTYFDDTKLKAILFAAYFEVLFKCPV